MKSPLQDIFLKELVEGIRASRKRILNSCESSRNLNFSQDEMNELDSIIWNELMGVTHSFLVSLDGGTTMADKGLVSITDEDGLQFDRYLHELVFNRLTDDELNS